ncbi:MAG: PAS domain-containing protein [Opitutus sp.]|nr:PAS domain-containing protein [Opitutus sp.]MCS6275189.1 PAS domain-containing protein [Opitutus sp.]MCS6279030.1 PAS domain-containing protein [Opitutus sp.]MCS6298636.1 PAS domain-containing protein [Opitutus sp.]
MLNSPPSSAKTCPVQGLSKPSPLSATNATADQLDVAELRARVEAAFREKNAGAPKSPEALSPETSQKLIDELCLKQIELDVLNDELRRVKAELGASQSQAVDRNEGATKTLLEKEERLALATLHNGIGIWDWNLVTQEMVWDDSMFALYRIRREDFVGTEEAWRASLHPEDLGRGDQEVREAIAGEKPFDTVFRVIWPDGEIRHIKAVAKVFRDELGTPLRMLGTNWDITAQMRAEADLLKRVEQFSALLLNLEAGVVCHAPDSAVVLNNARAAEILGLSDDQMRGKKAIDPAWRLTNEARAPLPLDHNPVKRIIKDKKPIKNQVCGIYRPGEATLTWVLVNGFPTLDAKGNITEILISFIDITTRVQAETALRDTNEKLEQRVVERTAELRDANQELLRLLAALAVAEEGERRRIAEGIHEDILQRLCVVKMALFWPPGRVASARFRASIGEAEKETGNIMTLLRSLTFDLASPVLKNHGLSAGLNALCTQFGQQHGTPIRFEPNEQTRVLPPEVEIIIFNAARELLRNVVRYAHAQNVVVALQPHPGCLELIVEDDGIGFDNSQPAKSFGPTGGYGLFSIRARMKQLRGEMRITPASPRGTRIVLAVPLTGDC